MAMQSDIDVLSKDIFIIHIHIVCLTSLRIIDLPLFSMSKNYYIYKTLFSLSLWVFIYMREINENHGNFRDKDNC